MHLWNAQNQCGTLQKLRGCVGQVPQYEGLNRRRAIPQAVCCSCQHGVHLEHMSKVGSGEAGHEEARDEQWRIDARGSGHFHTGP